MIQHIDLTAVLRRSVCELYSNLVTRPTGVAVRTEIELLVSAGPTSLTVIDFTHVGLLDYSCADEVVAKLLLRSTDGYFLCRGLNEAHIDAIEAALARYDLALVAETTDRLMCVIGFVGDDERLAWQTVDRLGSTDVHGVATALGMTQGEAEGLLESLATRRLVMRARPGYLRLPRP